jgi:cytochrome c oxidase subunit IV
MHQEQEHHDNSTGHRVAYAQYLLIWIGLLGLTALTVSLAGIQMGHWVIITALVIASVKSLLVLNIFMHLKFEDRVFRWFALVALATLVIFIVLTFFDYAFH